MYDSADLTSLFVVGLLLGITIGAAGLLTILVRVGKSQARK